MRCSCCNVALSDYESTLRHAITGECLDSCEKCLKWTEIPTKGRSDLKKKQLAEDDWEEDDLPFKWEGVDEED
jgi:hypothetical protein